MDNSSSHVESCWRTQLRNRIIQASSLLEILLSGLVLIGLLLSAVPLIKWMPGLLFDGNEVEIRIFLERSLDIVIGIEFIKMLAKHSPGSSLEVLLYAIARHLVVGHDSAVENLLSVGAIALIFIVRKFFFVPAFGAHLPDGKPAPQTAHQAGSNQDQVNKGAGDILPHRTGDKLYSDKQCQKNGGTAQRFQAAAGFLITHSRLLMMRKYRIQAKTLAFSR